MMQNPGRGTKKRGKPTRRPTPGGPPRSARTIACDRLADDAAHFPDLVPSPLDVDGLDPRDAALAVTIHDAAIRRWWTLAAVLSPFLRQPMLEPRMRAALLCGSAQLLLLDRLPAHAVINETVEWAKHRIRPGAGGMVNAVLRRVAGLIGDEKTYRDTWTRGRDEIPLPDGRALVLAEPVLPESSGDLFSAALSLPRPLLAAWRGAFGDATAERIACHTLARAPVIINARHALSPVPSTTPHERDGFLVYAGDELGALLGARRDIWVQDPASAGAVESVADLSPGVVVDLCAGRGTKTRQLRAVFPDAEIFATDTDPGRLASLGRVFASDDAVTVAPIDVVYERALGRAGLVLLDVPCSNTGVLARRPEARYRVGPKQTERLTRTQRQILADSIRLLSPGGSILYSTCSLEDAENMQIARWAARWHGFSPERCRLEPPVGLPGEPASRYRDGSFSVLLTR